MGVHDTASGGVRFQLASGVQRWTRAVGLAALVSASACARAPQSESATLADAGPPRQLRGQASVRLALAPEEGPLATTQLGGNELLDDGRACPAEMAEIGRYCIDRWEAHLAFASRGRFVVLHPHTERPKEGRAYVARSASGVFPQAYVSRVEAAGACERSHKRLCTFREWRRACRGRKGMRYPYGWRGVAGACNTGKPHLLPKLFGGDSRLWKYEQFNSPELLAEAGYLARAGEYPKCVGEDGTFDLLGNLHEWVSGTVTDDLMETLERDDVERHKQPWTYGNGIFVGGFFSTTNEHGPGCLFTTVAHEPRYHDYSTGFRCCRDARSVAKTEARPQANGPDGGVRP